MAVTINASTTNGLIQTADTTGNLSLQSNGTTIAALTSTGVAVTGAGSFTTTLGVTGTSTLAAVNASGVVSIGVTKKWFSFEDGTGNYLSNTAGGGGQGIYASATQAILLVGGSSVLTGISTGVTIPGTLGVTGKTTLSTADFQVGSGNGVTTPGLYCTSSVLWNFARDSNPAIEITRITNDGALVNFYNSAQILRGSISISGANTAYNTTSDGTLKNKIGAAPVDVSKKLIMDSPVSEFTWKDDPTEKKHIGVIAQELYESGFHGAVNVGGMRTDEKGNEKYEPWAVDKTAFQYHLVVLAQEHESQIQSLLARIATLEAK